MQFQTPLVRATLIRRYKRFLADVMLENGQEVTAHCANPGAMTGFSKTGLRIWVEPNDDPKRKLRYSWKLVEMANGNWAGIDTAMPNRIVAEALTGGFVPELAAYKTIRPEVAYGKNSRVDFLLTGKGLPDAYVEVKAVTLNRRPGLAEFPDSVTKRGTKHLQELGNMVNAGHRAVMLYLINRTDCTRFTVAADIDPTYAAAFDLARTAGVEVIAYTTTISPQAIVLAGPVALEER